MRRVDLLAERPEQIAVHLSIESSINQGDQEWMIATSPLLYGVQKSIEFIGCERFGGIAGEIRRGAIGYYGIAECVLAMVQEVDNLRKFGDLSRTDRDDLYGNCSHETVPIKLVLLKM